MHDAVELLTEVSVAILIYQENRNLVFQLIPLLLIVLYSAILLVDILLL